MLRTSQRVGRGWIWVGRREGIPQSAVECPSEYLPAFGKAGGFLGCPSPPSKLARQRCLLVEGDIGDPPLVGGVHLVCRYFGLFSTEVLVWPKDDAPGAPEVPPRKTPLGKGVWHVRSGGRRVGCPLPSRVRRLHPQR